ncbi:MAG: DNA recombination protein RmuC [Candidatus Zambryskibacteria bacterium]|nr:DNA recombination protein RmuC [Candidatus Zambryskibacteria bacterium]
MTLTTLLILIIAVNLVALFFFAKKFGSQKQDGGEGMKLLLTQLHEFSRTVDQKMAETNKMMNESVRAQFGESAKLIREVTQGLTKLDETNKQVVSFADQLQSLQDILKNPKQRGVLGEYYLETLLKNVLPPGSYQMQYAFSDGTIVDAAVFVKDKIIPIDSKFSLENYNRIVEEKNEVEREKLEKAFVTDLKNRITETSKYIQPSQGTMDFAFMFIPHEAIYYDLIVNKIGALKEDSETLIQRAASKHHVLIVSPTSFLAYLQTVLQGLNALHIEEKAVEIIKRVEELGRHLKSYEEYYGKLGNALSTTVNHYNTGYKELGKVDKDVLRITGTGAGLEPLTLERPSVE